MPLDEVVAWYQKKIGTYDKQQWEKTVEQRILNGFTNVPLKNTKLRTEFIDVDLVRGSSFPKAKPKQTLLTVIRLAFLRFLFLPLYAKWWVLRTSPKIFSFLLFLYGLQMLNWAVYSYNVNHKMFDRQTDNATLSVGDDLPNGEHIVSFTELLIPMLLSLLLSMIHSQIVATASNSHSNDKRQRALQPKHRRKRERSMKRRRKPTRTRNAQTASGADGPKETVIDNRFMENCDKKTGGETIDDAICGSRKSVLDLMPNQHLVSTGNISELTLCNSDSFIGGANYDGMKEVRLGSKIDLQRNCTKDNVELDRSSGKDLRRRNVNWDSPIKSHVIVHRHHQLGWCDDGSDDGSEDTAVDGVRNDQGEALDSGDESNEGFGANEQQNTVDQTVGDDDGFESLNGKSSSGEETGQTIGNTNRDVTPIATERPTQYSRSKEQLNQLDVLAASNLLLKAPMTIKFGGKMDSSDTDEEGDDGESLLSPNINSHYTEDTTSATEWIGITTNSEECSYSSGDLDHNSDSQIECSEGGTIEYDYFTPTVILNPTCGVGDRISCTIWDEREAKKAEMSVLDISSAIIERVEAMPETCDYVYIGVVFSIVLSLVPAFCRLCEAAINSTDMTEINFFDVPMLLMEKTSFSSRQMLMLMFGESSWQTTILVVDFLLRLFLTFLFFFLLAVAERTFKQRFLYAKLFSHLTSSRRARKSELPHFRLNKVRNIKTWLSVRSYLKRRGPQRSVEVIVSAAFILTLLLLTFLSVEWLKDSVQLQSQHTLQALIWSCALGCFILRFMTLGTKINRKYRCVSVLITEQINLYLQIEQKPHNKEELMVSNSVLKLAADLLKELESPFKISGLSANPYLYTTIKVVILSALSGVLSEMLGFKLKLHKIKIK